MAVHGPVVTQSYVRVVTFLKIFLVHQKKSEEFYYCYVVVLGYLTRKGEGSGRITFFPIRQNQKINLAITVL